MKVHCLFGVGGKQLPSGNDIFRVGILPTKNTNNFLGYLLMFNLVHLFLLKGDFVVDGLFFFKIPG